MGDRESREVEKSIGVGFAVGLVDPLITSLATLSIVCGIAYVWTDALTQVFPGPNLRWLCTGRVWGILLGALIMETLRNGLGLTDVSFLYQMIVWGVVLLLAVVIDQLRRGEAS